MSWLGVGLCHPAKTLALRFHSQSEPSCGCKRQIKIITTTRGVTHVLPSVLFTLLLGRRKTTWKDKTSLSFLVCSLLPLDHSSWKCLKPFPTESQVLRLTSTQVYSTPCIDFSSFQASLFQCCAHVWLEMVWCRTGRAWQSYLALLR